MEFIALPEPTAELVAEAIFEQWISRWGTMRPLLMDNGRRFTACLLQQLTDVYRIKHIYSSPYNPRGNFVVESYMRTLETTLKLCTQAVLPEPTAELVAEAIFEQWISRWGTMRPLLMDNGRRFTACLLQQLTDVYRIKHIYSSPYNPRGNFVVESYMRTLETTLKLCTQAVQTDWDAALQAATLAYRATPHTVTGHTPFFLATGQKLVLPLSREWHEPALCPLSVTWLEALWR